jgi:HlyD family secretion protein
VIQALKKKKTYLVAAVVVVIAVASVLWFNSGGSAADPRPATTTAKVERGDIHVSVSSTGRVTSNLDVDIKCKASGEIVKLPFDVSDPVTKGDLLLELDPKDQQRVLTQSEVELSSSKARLAIAKENLEIAQSTLNTDKRRAEAALKSAVATEADSRAKADRLKQLLEKKLSSQEEYDTAHTAAVLANMALENARVKMDEIKIQEQGLELKRQDVKVAESQVASDTISYSVAQDRLADTKVLAPMDGVVSARNVQIGQIISSAVSNVGGGTTVLTLSDLSRIFVLASVDESDIGKIKVGQNAIITADAFRGKVFRGKVVRLATKGVNSSNVVTFEVKIEVLGEYKSLLKPEMTANVEIIGEERKGALTVPVESLARKGGEYSVTVVKEDGTTEERPVKVGISDGFKSEVLGGIEEGVAVQVRKAATDSRWNSSSQRPQGGPPPGMMFGGGRR